MKLYIIDCFGTLDKDGLFKKTDPLCCYKLTIPGNFIHLFKGKITAENLLDEGIY
jgi:hypothetical protein